MVSNQWTTTDNADIPSADDPTITAGITSSSNLEHTATLSFYPLDVIDSGGYRCNMTIAANDVTGNNFVESFSTEANASIVVEGSIVVFIFMLYVSHFIDLSAPTVNIAASGNEIVGGTFILTCTVGVVDRLIVEPDIMWTKEALSDSVSSKSTIISEAPVCNNNSLSLNFMSLNTSDAARYTCSVVLNITQIGIAMTNDSYTDITLQSKCHD